MDFEKWVHRVFGKETIEKEDEQSQKFEGKLKKNLKTAPIFAKHAFFAIEVSHHKVASSSRQNTQRQNFLKNFLSVFRGWKVYPRGSRGLSRENLWVTFATGPSTHEQVTKIDLRTHDLGLRLD